MLEYIFSYKGGATVFCMVKRGKLIVFEGTDCSGKSTQIDLLIGKEGGRCPAWAPEAALVSAAPGSGRRRRGGKGLSSEVGNLNRP